MADIPRLNGVIRALEQGKPAFTTFAAAEVSVAQAVGAAVYDGVVFEMEHRAYDIRALRDCLQYMLDRRQIVRGQMVDVLPHPLQRRQDCRPERAAGVVVLDRVGVICHRLLRVLRSACIRHFDRYAHFSRGGRQAPIKRDQDCSRSRIGSRDRALNPLSTRI